MAFAQSATRRVLHHQVGHVLRQAKVENANNMRVIQLAQMTSFSKKVPCCLGVQMGVEHFDGSQSVEVDLLRQVHISEAARAQQADQAIVAKTLSNTLRHARTSSGV